MLLFYKYVWTISHVFIGSMSSHARCGVVLEGGVKKSQKNSWRACGMMEVGSQQRCNRPVAVGRPPDPAANQRYANSPIRSTSCPRAYRVLVGTLPPLVVCPISPTLPGAQVPRGNQHEDKHGLPRPLEPRSRDRVHACLGPRAAVFSAWA